MTNELEVTRAFRSPTTGLKIDSREKSYLLCCTLWSSTLDQSSPPIKLCGILGLTPKYRFGLYGPHSKLSLLAFSISATCALTMDNCARERSASLPKKLPCLLELRAMTVEVVARWEI